MWIKSCEDLIKNYRRTLPKEESMYIARHHVDPLDSSLVIGNFKDFCPLLECTPHIIHSF